VLGGKTTIIAPGVDLSIFQPSARPLTRRILYLGGQRADKGYDIAARLATTLVGPGIWEVAPEAIPGLIASHDVVLIPSRREPFGVVAVEAIASGRWVVAAAVGGLEEIVTDGLNGTLVRDGDFQSALARVPEYDPKRVSETVSRFGLIEQRRKMSALYSEIAREPV
jgi:glycosyltransferase involved in cell wall biosynthesis